MKKTLLAKLFLITCMYVHAQPTIQWQKCIGGSANDNARAMQLTNDGGYIITGVTLSNDGDVIANHTQDEIWVIKVNSSGGIQWSYTYGGSNIDRGKDVIQTDDGGYVIAASTFSIDGNITLNYGDIDYWIFKLDSIGSLVWEHCFGDVGIDDPSSIRKTSDGGFIIAGISYSTNGMVTGNHAGGGSDYWIVKLDAQGILEWQKCLGGSDIDLASEIREIPGGGYVVVGTTRSSDGDVIDFRGDTDYWLAKLDNQGSLVWQNIFGGSLVDEAWSVEVANDSGYIIAGSAKSTDFDVTGNHGLPDMWVVKTDQNGTLEWQKSFGGTGVDVARSVIVSSDGGYILAGSSSSDDGDATSNYGTNDLWIIKMDSLGTLQWQKSYGGPGSDQAVNIYETAIGEYVVCGTTGSDSNDVSGNHGGMDAWIIKLSTTVNVNDIDKTISEFNVSPNPFSNETEISFNLFSEEKTFIEITDIHGRIIKNIQTENLNRGTNKFVWDATSNSGYKIEKGIYFITIRGGAFNQTKKVVVM